MCRIGVPHDHCCEGVGLHLPKEVQAVEPLQIVEAVAILQLLHLHFEDEVEGRAQHAAERRGLFGKAADPEIDIVEAAEAVVVLASAVCSVFHLWLRKSRRSAGAPSPPKTRAMAASRAWLRSFARR